MYTREQGPKDGPDIRLPDNYGGTVFRGGTQHPPETTALPPGLLSDESAKYTSNTAARPPRRYIKKVPAESVPVPGEQPLSDGGRNFPLPPRTAATAQDGPEQSGEYEAAQKLSRNEEEPHRAGDLVEAGEKPHAKNPLKGLFSSIMPPGLGKRGEGELGFEEILIIGLILLLSQSDADNDILLLLALLLFCQ